MKIPRLKLHKSKLRDKILFSVLSTVIIVFIVVFSYIIINNENIANERAFKYMNISSQEYADLIKIQLDSDFSICRTIKHSFSDYKKYTDKERNDIYNNTLKTVLKNNNQFVSIWVSWELSAIRKDYNKEHGRQSIAYFKEGDYIGFTDDIMDTVGNPTGTYYEIKSNPSEVLTNPYYYSYSGNKEDEILEASIGIPLYEKEKFIGLVGADISIERFQEILTHVEPFEDCISVIVSSDGKIIGHSDIEKFDNTVSIENYDFANNIDFDLNKKIQSGKAFNYITSLNGKENYVSFAPLSLGKSGKYWYLGIAVPLNTILKEVRTETIISIVIALFGLIIISIVIWLLARTIIKPLYGTTKVLNLLSQGNLEETRDLEIKTKDEIATMARSLNTLIKSLKASAVFANQIGEGKLDADFKPLGSKDILGNSLLHMRDRLIEFNAITHYNQWLQNSILKISEVLQGEKTHEVLGGNILSVLADILKVQIGAVYIYDDDYLHLVASYAHNIKKEKYGKFKIGEGLVGQAAMEKKILLLDKIPDDYITIKSGLGQTKPTNIIVIPLVYEDQIAGIIELGSTHKFDEAKMEFVNNITENIAIALRSISLRNKMEELLAKTQEQAEELKVQQEELVESNKTLKSQTEALRVSEEELQQQQEELRVINEELEEKTKYLEKQKAFISEKNLDLENARNDLQRKANELGVASKYKSDFLANMSHELRTPLNSLLILSRDLADNSTNNLTEDQTEAAEIIYRSGSDLLSMINDILDLSKIESGKMTVNIEEVELSSIGETVHHYFKHITNQKGISLDVKIEDDMPSFVKTDQQKLEQILKNFISNGIKFTSKGGITVRFHNVDKDKELLQSGLSPSEAFAVSVEDTGIGIPKNKQIEIFEAFRQADTSISKNFGGTGLGLSISKELAKLLGGEIGLASVENEGSTFIVYLPLKSVSEENKNNENAKSKLVENKKQNKETQTEKNRKSKTNFSQQEEIVYVDDDKGKIKAGEPFILIVEDDREFAKILVKECHANNFKCIAVPKGEDALEIAKNRNVEAIILDIHLPGINGWGVMKLLKEDPETRHIPVHIMSGDDAMAESNRSGAIGFLQKPVSRESMGEAFSRIQEYTNKDVRNLLVVEDDKNLRYTIKKIIGEDGIEITEAVNGAQAIEILAKQNFDCMILDLGLPDMSGFELIEKIQSDDIHSPPIIVYTGRDISKEENEMLEKYAETVIIKGVRSADRLLDETSLFMHRVVADMPKKQKEIITHLYDKEDAFKDKKVLIVDDDMRNVFALTSVLNKHGLNVYRAENGKVALDVLNKENDIDIILMDIMMPVMDGYEAMQEIRKLKNFKRTPIIALTAKAMKGDKKKCIDSGASDYMAKPIDVDKLLSLMRVWLYK